MNEHDDEEIESGYIVVRSYASPVLASAANKLSVWVTMKMESGWAPLGPPQVHNDGGEVLSDSGYDEIAVSQDSIFPPFYQKYSPKKVFSMRS